MQGVYVCTQVLDTSLLGSNINDNAGNEKGNGNSYLRESRPRCPPRLRLRGHRFRRFRSSGRTTRNMIAGFGERAKHVVSTTAERQQENDRGRELSAVRYARTTVRTYHLCLAGGAGGYDNAMT